MSSSARYVFAFVMNLHNLVMIYMDVILQKKQNINYDDKIFHDGLFPSLDLGRIKTSDFSFGSDDAQENLVDFLFWRYISFQSYAPHAVTHVINTNNIKSHRKWCGLCHLTALCIEVSMPVLTTTLFQSRQIGARKLIRTPLPLYHWFFLVMLNMRRSNGFTISALCVFWASGSCTGASLCEMDFFCGFRVTVYQTRFHYFPLFQDIQNIAYLLNITFIFDGCYHSLAAVTHVEYKRDWKDVRGTFTQSKISLTEILADGVLVAPARSSKDGVIITLTS